MATTTIQQRRATLRETLERSGYAGALLSENYQVWSPTIGVGAVYLVGFARPDQQDMSTAAVVADVLDSVAEIHEHVLPKAVALAAPAVLVALPDRLSLWAVSANAEDTAEVVNASLAAPEPVISRLALLTPESVRRAKEAGAQTSLFPLSLALLDRARNESRRHLTEVVENVVVKAGDSIDPSRGILSPRLVIGALTVLMLRDKNVVSPTLQGGALIDVATNRFAGYFDWLGDLSSREQETFDEIVRDLSSNLNLAALEPAMVSDVYEQVLTTKATRREQGTFYTPPALARQILRVIPFEYLPDGKRYVLDPACGSGTLLLAAAARLQGLQPLGADPTDSHRYLVNHLRGFDRDQFATEITKLSLLMTALPQGNSWQIHTGDVLETRLSPADRPSIIVSNPPWSYSRTQGQRQERANHFVSWMLENLEDGGIMSCVLPLSWLDSDTSRGTRALLLSQASLIEVWRLPAETFQQTSSTIAPAVVVAQKRKSAAELRRSFTLVKTVRANQESVDRFLESGLADSAYLVKPGPAGEGIYAGPLTRYFEKRSDLVFIDTVAVTRNGYPQEPGRPKRTVKEASDLELASHRALHNFGYPDSTALLPVLFPEDFHHAGEGSIEYVRNSKLLVTAKRWNTTDPWRLKVGIDTDGIVPRESFHMLIPRADWSGWRNISERDRLFALLAVVGSGLAACWVEENNPSRNIRVSVLKSLPFPEASQDIKALAVAGRRIATAVKRGAKRQIQDAGRALEETIVRVYQLPKVIQQRVEESLAGHLAPEGVWRYPTVEQRRAVSISTPDAIPSYGQVLDVDDERGLRVWVSGITPEEGEWIGLPQHVSGWICSQDIDLYVSGNLNDLTTANYHLHVFDWAPDAYHSTAET